MKMRETYFLKLVCLSLLWVGISEGNLEDVELELLSGSPPPPMEVMQYNARSTSLLERLGDCSECLEEGCDACASLYKSAWCPLESREDNIDVQLKCIVLDTTAGTFLALQSCMCCGAGATCPPPVGPALMVCGGVTMCAGASWCVGDSARRVLYMMYSCRN